MMERSVLCWCLIVLHLAVFPVTVQAAVTLSTDGTFVENQDATFHCTVTPTYDPSTTRRWIGPGAISLISDGSSSDSTKYTETIDAANNMFSMTIKNYNSADEGDYQCQYGFPTSNTINLSTGNTYAYPTNSPLENIPILVAGAAISLSIPVAGIRPSATASFNLTSSTSAQTAIVSGNAQVTDTNAADGRTTTSLVQIDVAAGTTSIGNIFTVTLVVGDYSVTKQWTITESTTPNTPPSTTSNTNGSKDSLTVIIIVICSVGGTGVIVVVVVVIHKRKNSSKAPEQENTTNGGMPMKSEGNCNDNNDTKHTEEHNQRM